MASDLNSIIEKIKEGDERAFKEFFFMFYNDILRFLYFYIGDEDISKDLAQETFINFWKARFSIDISSNPKGYLFRIARNLAINYIERGKNQERIDEIKILPPKLVEKADFESFEVEEEFLKAIEELPTRCREIFILSRYNGLSYKEIASILGISLQTVKNHMVRALNYLRGRLKKYLF